METATRSDKPATSLVAEEKHLPLGKVDRKHDQEVIENLFNKPSGSREKFKKRWIEFDCQKGVHHGKWATYENGQRTRVKGGYIGRFDKVARLGEYGIARVRDFVTTGHKCHYPERLFQDLEECGVGSIEIQSWPSGRSLVGFPDGRRASGSGNI
ncbi:MAG: hypothetical protein EHM33_01990 [Chloroflexi bacterium]|nr:MAG: hypothetical protein EHM33_01990 [Chloroflexota bacterium]